MAALQAHNLLVVYYLQPSSRNEWTRNWYSAQHSPSEWSKLPKKSKVVVPLEEMLFQTLKLEVAEVVTFQRIQHAQEKVKQL